MKEHALTYVFTIDLKHIKDNKDADEELKELKTKKTANFATTTAHNVKLETCNNKICVPEAY